MYNALVQQMSRNRARKLLLNNTTNNKQQNTYINNKMMSVKGYVTQRHIQVYTNVCVYVVNLISQVGTVEQGRFNRWKQMHSVMVEINV